MNPSIPRQTIWFRVRLSLRAVLVGMALLCAGPRPRAFASDWPQFLGPTRNGDAAETNLAATWPTEGPPVTWRRKVGQGFSGPVVSAGKLILFHRLADKETVECLEAQTGKTLWSFDYPTDYQDDFGFDEGPRATPTIADGRVLAFGAGGILSAVDFVSGKKLWSVDTRARFQPRKGFFGAASSPLVESGRVLLNVGGADGAGIVAFEAATGQVAWQATGAEASYASPVAAELTGRRRAIFFTRSGLVGLEPATGKVAFEFPWRSRQSASVNAATPLVLGDLIFLSASYQTGAVLLRVTNDAVEKVWSGDEAFSNHYATSVAHEGFLYGFDGRQEQRPSLRCVELRSGKVRWSEDGFGAGTVTRVGSELLLLKETGQLVRATATPEKFQPRATAQILPSGVRAHPALADGFLFARSKDTLVCADLRPTTPAPGK